MDVQEEIRQQRLAALRTRSRPLMALMMSIAMPGLGQIYLRQGEFGAFLYLLPNVAVVLCFLFTDAVGVLLSLVFLFVVYLYACMRAYHDAKKLPVQEPRWYNHPMIYLLLFTVHIGFTTWLTNPHSSLGQMVVIRAFKAKSIAMEPTILRGDLLFTFHRPTRAKNLDYGDVVVVREPEPKNRFQIRRVVGLPGDEISVFDGLLFRNGQALSFELLDTTPKYGREGYIYYTEQVGARSYITSQLPGQAFESGKWTVEPGQCFVVADRRHMFTDSLLWGPIRESRVIGRVAFIFWPRGEMKRFGRVIQDPPS